MCALLMVVSPKLHICFSPRLRDKVVWYKMEFLRCLILIHQDKLLRRLRIIGRPKQIANDLPKPKKYKWRKIVLTPWLVQGPWKMNLLKNKYWNVGTCDMSAIDVNAYDHIMRNQEKSKPRHIHVVQNFLLFQPMAGSIFPIEYWVSSKSWWHNFQRLFWEATSGLYCCFLSILYNFRLERAIWAKL